MRLVWLTAASTSWREIALESCGCGLLALVLTVILSQRSYEALLVLQPEASEAQPDSQLAGSVCAALNKRSPEPAVRMSAELVAPAQIWLSCRAEHPTLALEACERAAEYAANRFRSLRIVKLRTSVPDSDDVLRYSLFSALAALAWLLVRVRQFYVRRRAEPEPEGFWTVGREPSEVAAAAEEQIAPSFRAPRRTPTWSGMPPIAASPGAGPQAPESEEGAAPELPLPANQNAPAAGIATRVVFQVGGNPYKPDTHVLTDRTMHHLQELTDELLASTAQPRVIRVASAVGSRYAKTQVAAQLAVLLAKQPDTKVLVSEGDVDAPALHKAMRLEAPLGLGLSEQLQRLAALRGRGTLSIIRVQGNLHALLESRASAPGALGTPLFSSMLHKMRSEHAFVIVDGPVVDNWPDVTHLADCVDSVVWVTGAGTRVRDSLALAERHFEPDSVLHLVAADDWVAAG